MPRASDGSYSLPPGTIVSSGDTIEPSQHNPAMQDIAQALGNSLDRNGSGGMRAPLNMGGYSVQNAGNGSAPSDLATVAQIGLSIPVGAVLDFAGAVAPDTFLFAYGQAISRVDYAELFTAIGTAYGAGNGSTTFNLPDLRGRVVAGKDDMGGTSANRLTGQTGGVDGDVIGASGGAETHTLSTAQMPSHNHDGATSSAGGHSHAMTRPANGVGGSDNPSNPAWNVRTSTFYGNQSPLTEAAGEHSHVIASAGGGQAHNNVQPTTVLNKIIKARSA